MLKECLTSLYKIEQTEEFEVIIVDNNSKDDSRQIIEHFASLKSNIKPFFLDKDSGFSYANNRGFELAAGEYVLIMNPDIIFAEAILTKLKFDIENNSKIGAICPLLVGTDGNFQRNYFQRYPTVRQFIYFHSIFAKWFYKFPNLMNKYLENQDIDTDSKTIQLVEQIPCAFFFTTRKIFYQAGKMDESYLLFFEDVDLSYQINKSTNLAIDASIKVTHLGGSSFKSTENWWLFGRFIISMNNFFDKNYSWIRALILKILCLKNSLLIIMIEYIKKLLNSSDDYRMKKHKYFIKEFINHYLHI